MGSSPLSSSLQFSERKKRFKKAFYTNLNRILKGGFHETLQSIEY
jgi:hypothetical protein